jgi:hypothetical protein
MILFSKTSRLSLMTIQPPIPRVPWVLSWGSNGRAIKLTIHLHVVPMLRTVTAIPIQLYLYNYTYTAIPIHLYLYSYTYTAIPIQLYLYSYTYTAIDIQLYLYSYAFSPLACLHCVNRGSFTVLTAKNAVNYTFSFGGQRNLGVCIG